MTLESSRGSTAAGSSESAAPRDEAAEVRRWLGVLNQGWTVLLAGALVGAAIGALTASRSAPAYEAVAVLNLDLPEDEREDIPISATGLRPLLLSESVASRVVQELGLGAPPYSMSGPRFLSRAMSLEGVPNTTLLRLSVRLRDAAKAEAAARRVAEHLEELTARIWRDSLQQRIADLQPQVEGAREALARAEERWMTARTGQGQPAPVPRGRPGARQEGEAGRKLAERLTQAPGSGDALRFARAFELLRLENDVEVGREVYMDLSREIQIARLEHQAQPRPLRMVDPPSVPEAPLPGSRNRTIALGTIAGLILAACVVVGREWRAAGS